jgi:hypothetical protein
MPWRLFSSRAEGLDNVRLAVATREFQPTAESWARGAMLVGGDAACQGVRRGCCYGFEVVGPFWGSCWAVLGLEFLGVTENTMLGQLAPIRTRGSTI